MLLKWPSGGFDKRAPTTFKHPAGNLRYRAGFGPKAGPKQAPQIRHGTHKPPHNDSERFWADFGEFRRGSETLKTAGQLSRERTTPNTFKNPAENRQLGSEIGLQTVLRPRSKTFTFWFLKHEFWTGRGSSTLWSGRPRLPDKPFQKVGGEASHPSGMAFGGCRGRPDPKHRRFSRPAPTQV